jgi:hypothetical protein
MDFMAQLPACAGALGIAQGHGAAVMHRAVMHCEPLTSRPRLWLSGFWYVGRLWYGSVGPQTRQKG